MPLGSGRHLKRGACSGKAGRTVACTAPNLLAVDQGPVLEFGWGAGAIRGAPGAGAGTPMKPAGAGAGAAAVLEGEGAGPKPDVGAGAGARAGWGAGARRGAGAASRSGQEGQILASPCNVGWTHLKKQHS